MTTTTAARVSLTFVSFLVVWLLAQDKKILMRFRLVPKFQGDNFYANKKISGGFKALAKTKGCTVAQVALAWVAAQGMIAIPGTTKPSRLEENWASRDIELTEEELKE